MSHCLFTYRSDLINDNSLAVVLPGYETKQTFLQHASPMRVMSYCLRLTLASHGIVYSFYLAIILSPTKSLIKQQNNSHKED